MRSRSGVAAGSLRCLRRAVSAAAGAYDLRHSFASLLLHEGRDVIYVARQLGHGAELTLRTYGHVIEELEDSPRLPAEEAIRQARETMRRPAGVLCALCAFLETRRAAIAGKRRCIKAPRAGFEPAAYSLGGSRSIRLSYRGTRRAMLIVAQRSARSPWVYSPPDAPV